MNMSTSSTVTASVEVDTVTLGDDIDIRNGTCILVTIQGDSIPLGPSSFKEQDVVELCIQLDQEHPEGVFQLLDTEAVLAFWCYTNMMATTHHLKAAKVCWGEPIVLHILPPKGEKVREYIAKRGLHPSGA